MRGTSMDEQKMESQTVGVVGPGRMGIGIATAILAGGPHHQVHLFDVKKREAGKEEEALLSAENEIQTNLRLLQELGLTSGSPDKALPSLSLERRLEESRPSCSLVFEALPEDISVKGESYSQPQLFSPTTPSFFSPRPPSSPPPHPHSTLVSSRTFTHNQPRSWWHIGSTPRSWCPWWRWPAQSGHTIRPATISGSSWNRWGRSLSR